MELLDCELNDENDESSLDDEAHDGTLHRHRSSRHLHPPAGRRYPAAQAALKPLLSLYTWMDWITWTNA
jgi:hypothetical protein